METKRKPFQGVLNILRFNWHFYLIAGVILIAFFAFSHLLPKNFHNLVVIGTGLITAIIFISLITSFYIYDLSNLYQLKWLYSLDKKINNKILNIHAGFDETSEIIMNLFAHSELIVCDFYDPEKHTEISIKRARKAYPLNPKTISVKTSQLPFSENTFDRSIVILSAHEIRKEEERILFFKELNRTTQPSGQIFVTEHLRDFNNFCAYTIGFFHFYSRKNWLYIFKQANLSVVKEIKTTPFITTFILKKNGNTL